MFGTIQRDPMLHLLHHLEHRIGRTFNEPFRAAEWPLPEAVTTAWLPLVDIFEEPDAIRLVAELPGVRPSEVKISVEDNLLTITLPKAETAKPHLIKVEITPAKPLLTPDLRSPSEEGGMGRSPTGPESLETY